MRQDEERSGGRGIFFELDRCRRKPYSYSVYAARFGWAAIERLIGVMWTPRRLRLKRSFLRLFGADAVGHVDRKARVWHPWLFSIGKLSTIGEGVTVYNLARVDIGEQAVVSQDVYLCAGTHDHLDPTMPLVCDQRAAIRIEDGVWICAGAFIGPGVSIGRNSIVGARAVVMSDVGEQVIVAGNPARVIGKRPCPKFMR